MTATTTAVGVSDQMQDQYADQDQFADNGAPLVKHLHIRVSGPSYAAIVTRALAEGRPEAEVARRWMRRGALAEGCSFDAF